jgi:hypothetical protein
MIVTNLEWCLSSCCKRDSMHTYVVTCARTTLVPSLQSPHLKYSDSTGRIKQLTVRGGRVTTADARGGDGTEMQVRLRFPGSWVGCKVEQQGWVSSQKKMKWAWAYDSISGYLNFSLRPLFSSSTPEIPDHILLLKSW